MDMTTDRSDPESGKNRPVLLFWSNICQVTLFLTKILSAHWRRSPHLLPSGRGALVRCAQQRTNIPICIGLPGAITISARPEAAHSKRYDHGEYIHFHVASLGRLISGCSSKGFLYLTTKKLTNPFDK